MRIQHNIMAMSAYRNYSNNTSALSKNLEKLSSGYKINRAGDDAAGLAISEKMRAQITGLKAANKNVKDGVSLVQTAEGALQEVHDMLNRMDSLATQSANGTYDNDVDRMNLQKEVDALKSEIDRIADSSNFNGQKLLNGDLYSGTSVAFANTATADEVAVNGTITANSYEAKDGTTKQLTFKFAVDTGTAETAATVDDKGVVTITLKKGVEATADVINEAVRKATAATGDDRDAIEKALKSVTFSGSTTVSGAGTTIKNATGTATNKDGSLTLQIGDTADNFNKMKVNVGDMHVKALGIDTVDISNQDGAAAAIASIKAAINTVSSTRGDLGAVQNRLEHTQKNLSVMTENIQDAESTIRDTDVADEMMAYTKNNILIQSAQAMLAQANQVPQGVLQLLQ